MQELFVLESSFVKVLNVRYWNEILMSEELTQLTAAELAAIIRDRQVSAQEVTESHLRRIDRLNPRINAFCTVLHEKALTAAKAADVAMMSGRTIGKLHGLPIGLKDLTPTKGVRTTRGSRLFADYVPNKDAVLVQRIKAAGGIIIGKTNTPEFGHKGITDNLIFGATRNPWDLSRVAGGSSGGSAAAVAAGLVPLAEGSDGAGSIRIPASMCGVFGFKPTYGRVPDVLGAFSSHSPFFHNGPITRSVEDAALLYQAMAGADPSDPFSLPYSEEDSDSLEMDVSGLRVAYSPDLDYFQVAADVRQACADAADTFAGLGCQVDEFEMGLDIDIEYQFMTLWSAKLASTYSNLSEAELGLLEPKVQELIADGKRLSAVDYGHANLARERLWNRLCAVYQDYDLILCPTTAVAAFPSGQDAPHEINGKAINPLIGWFLTYPFNLTGHPAASVPCGLSADGLPVGLQIIGRRLEDRRVLRAARAFERIRPWQRLVEPALG